MKKKSDEINEKEKKINILNEISSLYRRQVEEDTKKQIINNPDLINILLEIYKSDYEQWRRDELQNIIGIKPRGYYVDLMRYLEVLGLIEIQRLFNQTKSFIYILKNKTKLKELIEEIIKKNAKEK